MMRSGRTAWMPGCVGWFWESSLLVIVHPRKIITGTRQSAWKGDSTTLLLQAGIYYPPLELPIYRATLQLALYQAELSSFVSVLEIEEQQWGCARSRFVHPLFYFCISWKNWIQSGTGAMYRVCPQSCSLESMNVCSTFHENPFNIYCDISVPGQNGKWTGWRTDWQTEIRPSSHTRTVPKKGQNLRGGN